MEKILFITALDAAYGFNLAGVEQYSVSREEAWSVLARSIREPDFGLIVVDERLLEGIPEEAMKEFEDRFPGIIITMPPPERYGPEIEDYALRLIRRAIGYHIKLKI